MLAATGFALGPAAFGLIGTHEDACVELYEETPSRGPGRFHAFADVSEVPYLYSHCEVIRHGAPRLERITFNWIGTISALAFLIGVFFASAGILGLVDPRRAVVVTAACVLICLAMVVIFFA